MAARLITHNGVTDSLQGWARRTGLGRETIAYRLNRGWSPNRALTSSVAQRFDRLQDRAWLWREYVDNRRGLLNIAKELGCTDHAVHAALRRLGIPARSRGPEPVVATGDRFERLVVIAALGMRGSYRFYRCRCECGEEIEVRATSLREGNTKSCGCLKRDKIAEQGRQNTTHGLSHHPLYQVWGGMHDRCKNLNAPSYARYGGRGIKVCDRWAGEFGFPCYLEDVGERPGPGYELHRIDNDGDYQPGNVEWLPKSEHMKLHQAARKATQKWERV